MTQRLLTVTALGTIIVLAFAAPNAAAQDLAIPEDGIVLEGLEAVQEPAPMQDPFADDPFVEELEAAPMPAVDLTPQPLIEPELLPEEDLPALEELLPVEAAEQDVPSPVVMDVEVPMPAQEELEPVRDIETLEDKAGGATQVSNTFFDSEDLPGAEREFTDEFLPVETKAVPEATPASKMVVVTKSSEADTQKAKQVAAARALELGRYGAAMEFYDELYNLNPRDPNILSGRALTLQKLGRFDEAILAYEELFDVDADNLEAQVNMLGLMSEKYPSVALRRLALLRDESPSHVGIISQMAIAQARLGQYEEAMVSLGMAASMEPGNAGHVFNMAVISDRAGYHREAMSYYEQALEIDSIYGGARSIPRDSIYARLADLRR